jgi:hypothetical protein
MKKLVIMLVFVILVLGLVGAVSDNAQMNSANANSVVNTNQQTQNQGDDSELQITNKIMVGDYENKEGKMFRIEEKENKRLRIHSGNVSADCDCNLTQEKEQNKTKLKVQLKNGRNAEIKVMPDTASETALARLRLSVCSAENNCSIELKEVGSGDGAEAGYEVQAQRHFRILGLFRTKAQVRAEVSAESGEVIQVKKPWWAFLASMPEE